MQESNQISNELLEISRLIAGIDRKNRLFELPSGYFETFADGLMARIKNESVQSVKTELETLSPLISQLEKKNVFSIPENYFESFPEKLLIRLKAEQAKDAAEELSILSPLLSQINKKTPFSTPAGFFEELPDNLIHGMKAVELVNDELENLSPMMSSLRNKQPYTVPVGYFDGLVENVLFRLKTEEKNQPAKVVAFKKRRQWLRYAVAAAVAGVILTFGIIKFNRQTTVQIDDPSSGLSKISDQEILNYMQDQDIPLAQAANNNTASLDFSDNDIKDMLGDISDSELQQYLNEEGDLKDGSAN